MRSEGAGMSKRYQGLNGKQKFDLHVMRYNRSKEVWREAVPWAGRIVMVLCAWVPLQAIRPMVEDLAGKSTNLTLTMSIAYAAAVASTVGVGVQSMRVRNFKMQIGQLTGKLSVYEDGSLKEVNITRGSKKGK